MNRGRRLRLTVAGLLAGSLAVAGVVLAWLGTHREPVEIWSTDVAPSVGVSAELTEVRAPLDPPVAPEPNAAPSAKAAASALQPAVPSH
jgi:hypothetical protein